MVARRIKQRLDISGGVKDEIFFLMDTTLLVMAGKTETKNQWKDKRANDEKLNPRMKINIVRGHVDIETDNVLGR